MPSCLINNNFEKVIVPDFPSWDINTYIDKTFIDPGSELLIPMPNKPYICCCPVIQPDGPHDEIEEWHTEECWLRREIWESYNGIAPILCDRCGDLEHEGFRCDWGSDAGEVMPSWDSGKIELEYLGYGEEPVADDEPDPDGCLGWGCQRGNCSACKESQKYWTYCSNTSCPFGDHRPIRWSTATCDEGGFPFCHGCIETKSVEFPICVRCHNTGRQGGPIVIYAKHKDGSGFVCTDCCSKNRQTREFSDPNSTLVRVVRCGGNTFVGVNTDEYGCIRECPYDSITPLSSSGLDIHGNPMCWQCAIDEESKIK